MQHVASERLKILLGVHVFFPRHRAGTEVLTLELARGLRARGHCVEILAGEREEQSAERSEPWLTEDVYDGFSVYRIHYGVKKLRDPIGHHTDSAKRISLVKEVVSQTKPHVLHFHHLFGFSAQVIPDIRRLGVPVIFTPTDYWVACPKSILYRTYDKVICDGPGMNALDCVFCLFPIPKWAGKLTWKVATSSLRHHIGPVASVHSLMKRTKTIANCVNNADRILPSTNFLAGILTHHGVDERRMRVIPYGIDVGHLPERISVPDQFTKEKPLRLGFIGQLAEIKGPHVLIESISLLGNRSSLVSLRIYGKQDQGSPYYRQLARSADKADRSIVFEGTFPHEKIGEILRGIHFLVVPSLWYESTPLVLCSALSAGTPVLVSRLGGMTEIVEEGGNGFSFPAGDPAALEAIISRLLDNPGMIKDMGKKMITGHRSGSDYVRDVESEYFSVRRGG